MAHNSMSPEKVEEAKAALTKYGNASAASRALGISRSTLRDRLSAADNSPTPSEKLQFEATESDGVITAVSKTIRTLEDALAAADVDSKVWEVERHVINKWDMGAKLGQGENEKLAAMELWQVKVWLRRRSPIETEVLIDALVEKLRKYAPRFPKLSIRSPKQGTIMAEACLFDMHFGKLAWGEETGEDYDTKIAVRRFKSAVEGMISKMSSYKVSKILFPLGNDLLHANNAQGTTEKGTRLDVDSRIQKAYLATYEVLAWAVEMFAQVAPVEIVEVKGNHDPLLTFTLCHALNERYLHTKKVEVDLRPLSRKYKQWGVSLLGYTHGNTGKQETLPRLMAIEAPMEFAAAKYREWHIGHFHKKKEDRYNAGDTYEGVRVRVIPTLSGTDAWHAESGYVKQPQEAELYLWDREQGLESYYPIRAVAA